MVRAARRYGESESEIYHIVSRGVGRQLIFEDDEDRCAYLALLRKEIGEHGGSILAWCLMSNHVHLLLKIGLEGLSTSMKRVNSAYVLAFNKRHDRIGHLMQGRFKSEPVDSEAYLLTVVRYIHQNPEKAGIAKTAEYPWSSYHEYAGGDSPGRKVPQVSDTSFVLDLIGGKREFARLHDRLVDSAPCIDEGRGRRILDDESALRAAREILAPLRPEEVAALPKNQRDAALCSLKTAKISVRQIERITGVSKSVVAKAKSGQ